MPRDVVDVPLDAGTAGTARTVRMVRYGAPEARPKAYLHAGLHADESPGYLVAQHLLQRLDAAEARGEIAGRIVVAPWANPIGLAQYVDGEQLGRHDLATGQNFNRGWPDLSERLAGALAGRLGDDAAANAQLIRQAMRAALDEHRPSREIDALRRILAREACDADLVLDLHCDDEGLLHLFLPPSLWPAASDLAGELDCAAVLTAEATGGASFSETIAAPWDHLARAFPDAAIPTACLSATVELRGFADTGDALAARDAAALVRVLQRRGCLAGDPGPAPSARCEAVGFDACDILRAPAAGIVSYRAELGERVRRGDPVADLIELSAVPGEDARRPVRAGTDGLVLTRRLRKLVAGGEVIAKIVGREPLAHRQGYLLED